MPPVGCVRAASGWRYHKGIDVRSLDWNMQVGIDVATYWKSHCCSLRHFAVFGRIRRMNVFRYTDAACTAVDLCKVDGKLS